MCVQTGIQLKTWYAYTVLTFCGILDPQYYMETIHCFLVLRVTMFACVQRGDKAHPLVAVKIFCTTHCKFLKQFPKIMFIKYYHQTSPWKC